MILCFLVPYPVAVIIQKLRLRSIYDRYEYDYDETKPNQIFLKRLDYRSIRDWYPTNLGSWLTSKWKTGDDEFRMYYLSFSESNGETLMELEVPAFCDYERIIEFFEQKLDAKRMI